MRELARRGRIPILGLLTVGFVAGIAVAVGCGGGGGGTAFAEGATVVRHVARTTARTESSSGILVVNLFTTSYTPPDPDDVILRVGVRGTYTTTANSMLLSVLVTNGAGNLTYVAQDITVPAGTNRGYLVSSDLNTASSFSGAGGPDGTYQISVTVANGDPGGSSIDLGAATLEVISMSGVMALDPSPEL